MAKPAPSHVPTPTTGSSKRRALWIGAAVLLVLVVLIFVFGERYQTSRWLSDLYSDDPKTVQAARVKMEQSDIDGLNEALLEVLEDPDAAFRVRRTVGSILLKRNRLNLVEQALRADDVKARTAALAVLYGQVPDRGIDWFRRDYADRPELRVPETVLAWLDLDRDASRTEAVKIAAALQMEEALPHIRGFIGRADLQGATRKQQRLVIEAAAALLRMRDCASIEKLVEPALSEEVDVVRLRMVQALYRATLGPGAPCPDALARDRVKEVVFAALDGPSNTQHGAILILRNEPEWVSERTDTLLDLVDDEEFSGLFRRSVLDVLVVAGPPEFLRRLPRYFHDPSPYVRSTAVAASVEAARSPDATVRFDDAWVGIVRNETENEHAFYGALGGLRRSVGSWPDLPDDLVQASAEAGPAWLAFRKTLFESGESRGIERQAWARRWYVLWAERRGLSAEAAADAWATREAFWEAATVGDVAGARRVIEGANRREDGLFTYEVAWLERQP